MNQDPNAGEEGVMRRLWWLVVVVVAIVGLLVLLRVPPQQPAPLPPTVSVSQASALRARGALLIDVRQPEEWVQGHVPGSALIPIDDLPSRLRELPRDRTIVVVCHSGKRSRFGRDVLLKAGFTQVASMSGGLAQWEAQGQPIVTGP
jgi:rhodanese-related sulfurtransferase